jgi:hypothetical protein
MPNDQPVHIRFSRDGGFAGRTIRAVVDSATMPAAQLTTLRRLLEEADVFEVSLPPVARPQPDGFRIHVVVDVGSRHREIDAAESSIPESMQPLIDFLIGLAKGGPAGGVAAGGTRTI